MGTKRLGKGRVKKTISSRQSSSLPFIMKLFSQDIVNHINLKPYIILSFVQRTGQFFSGKVCSINLITTSVPCAMFTHFLVENG